MCGAIALKRAFPTYIIYISKGREEIIKNIISRTNLTDEQKTLRILSIDAERKNKNICDYIISENNSYEAMMKTCSLVQK